MRNIYIGKPVKYGNKAGIVDDIDTEDSTARVSFSGNEFQWVSISELE